MPLAKTSLRETCLSARRLEFKIIKHVSRQSHFIGEATKREIATEFSAKLFLTTNTQRKTLRKDGLTGAVLLNDIRKEILQAQLYNAKGRKLSAINYATELPLFETSLRNMPVCKAT